LLNGTQETYNSSSLIHSIDRSISANLVQRLDSSLKFNNAVRYSAKTANWNATGAVFPLAVNDLTSYAILGLLGRPGTYNFTNAKTGSALGSVYSQSGYDFMTTKNNFPGAAVASSSLFFEPLLLTKNKTNEFLDQFSFTKTLKNMSFTLGGFYGYSSVTQYSGSAGVGLGTIQNHPDLVNMTITNSAGQVYQATNPNGITFEGGGGFAENKADQNQLAIYFGHNWQISQDLNLDYGVRFESVHVKGFAAPGVINPKSSDPAYGGTDGNPLTLYDNAGGTTGTHYGFDKTVKTLSYSAGLNYKLSDRFSLYGRYSQGNKAPDLSIYFAANTPFASSTLAAEAQKVTQAEAGIKLNNRNFTLFVTPFYSVLSHVPTIQTFTQADNITQYNPPTLYEKIRTYGVELESKVDFTQSFSVKAIATLQNSKALDYKVWIANASGPADDAIMDYSGKKTDNSANVILSVTPSYNTGKFFSFITWQYLGAREANVANAFELPAFSQFNLGTGYDFTKKLQVSFNINNVLNKYGVMSWSRPGTFLQALDRQGYTKAMYEADSKANKTYSTIAIPARAYYLTLTYKF
jgi:iron complex outermembrane receptor protein